MRGLAKGRNVLSEDLQKGVARQQYRVAVGECESDTLGGFVHLVRMAGDHRLYLSNLLRFQRVFGYGARARQDVRFRFGEKLQLPLYIQKHYGILAQMAYIIGLWFREYVYIPLGGNRLGLLKQFRNLLVVWFLTGLWHGANWNFIIWGLYFGLFVTVEKLFLLKWLQRSPTFMAHIYTLLIVIVGWVWFDFDHLASSLKFIGVMFGYGANGIADDQAFYALSTHPVLLILLALCATPLPGKVLSHVKEKWGSQGRSPFRPCVLY